VDELIDVLTLFFCFLVSQRADVLAAAKTSGGVNPQFLTFRKDGQPQGKTCFRMWTDKVQEVMVVFFIALFLATGKPGGGGKEYWYFEFGDSNLADSSRNFKDPRELEDYVMKMEPFRKFQVPTFRANSPYRSVNNWLLSNNGAGSAKANPCQKIVEGRPWLKSRVCLHPFQKPSSFSHAYCKSRKF
jgi:hypothetical protein